jgi:hypothetical protein
MKVAVPAPQHSPIFGQLPLAQIVWSLLTVTSSLTLRYSSPIGSFTFNQSGFFGFSVVETVMELEEVFSLIFLSF